MKIKKTYRYAFISALYLTLFAIITMLITYALFYHKIGWVSILICSIVLFIVSFALTQYRAENFIYQRIKQLYEDISILDVKDLHRDNVTTDVELLTKSVQDYVENKSEEIANLTEKDSFRRDFLGNVAHELKTPLFTVQGYILTLLEGAAEDKAIRDKYLDRANKGVERLSSIVKDLDMITKIETEGLKMNRENFHITELVQNVFDLLEIKARKKNIQLKFNTRYEFPINVYADIERIEQVLINLIENSIKYGKVDGVTTVAIDNYNKHKLTVRITDNGEGVKQENIPRLFERFYRVDQSRSREQGGSGLGLSIVKHIIEAHDETILLKSKFGKGSEFSFTIEKARY